MGQNCIGDVDIGSHYRFDLHSDAVTRQMFPYFDTAELSLVIFGLLIHDNQEIDGARLFQEWQGVIDGARSRRASVPAADQAVELHSVPLDIWDDVDGTARAEQRRLYHVIVIHAVTIGLHDDAQIEAAGR